MSTCKEFKVHRRGVGLMCDAAMERSWQGAGQETRRRGRDAREAKFIAEERKGGEAEVETGTTTEAEI